MRTLDCAVEFSLNARKLFISMYVEGINIISSHYMDEGKADGTAVIRNRRARMEKTAARGARGG